MAVTRRTMPDVGQAVAHLSRRRLAGVFLLGILSGIVVTRVPTLSRLGDVSKVVGSPDAELISLCVRCDRLQDRIDILHVPPANNMSTAQEIAWEETRDALVTPIIAQQEPVLLRICELRATTLPGHAARAATLMSWDKYICSPLIDNWTERLVCAIIRDLIA